VCLACVSAPPGRPRFLGRDAGERRAADPYLVSDARFHWTRVHLQLLISRADSDRQEHRARKCDNDFLAPPCASIRALSPKSGSLPLRETAIPTTRAEARASGRPENRASGRLVRRVLVIL
jgi:hypothetical protein